MLDHQDLHFVKVVAQIFGFWGGGDYVYLLHVCHFILP